MTDYVSLAKQALEKPSDFGWWGFDEMFDTWGFSGIDMNRDSDILQISNYHAAIKDCKHEFGEDVWDENFQCVGFGHWAVGHVDRVCVKILNNSIAHDSITEDDITEYFKYIVDIAVYLAEEYPILDEQDYSERQWVEASKWIEDMATSTWIPFGQKCVIEEGFGDSILSWLNYNDCYEIGYHDDGSPYYDEKDLTEAIYDLGFDDREDEESNIFWSEWEMENISAKSRRKNRREEENGQLTLEFEYDYH